ncbi:MAG: LysR family transcriptional regulator [Rhodospirillum sp.]|nr:LysR family transcriptional regulator [Rhodospirillum sp.]MCF8489036.1 LysR family transcriptional regulator [Rhodospirillum sp.]MCF8499775.1 LysR family transcriptional regulator [Rhodospirillum sp.]
MPSHGRLRLRLKLCGFAILGPGKADLLETLKETGSISAAARTNGLSYRKAWAMLDELNRAFQSPLVATSFGGAKGGGARLTEMGETVLTTYRELERKTLNAAGDEIALLQSLSNESAPKGDPDAPECRFIEEKDAEEDGDTG